MGRGANRTCKTITITAVQAGNGTLPDATNGVSPLTILPHGSGSRILQAAAGAARQLQKILRPGGSCLVEWGTTATARDRANDRVELSIRCGRRMLLP